MDLKQGTAKTAFDIAERLRDGGHTAYFAGGCVRDFLRKQIPQDFDIATTATPDQVEKLFSKTVPVGKQFGVMLVIENQKNFEVATFRSEGGYQDGRHPTQVKFSAPEEDALRRDFTVNGMFYDPFAQKVIDYVGGKEDIQRRLIRAIGDPAKRFEEDKLRLLRAIRFASFLGYEIESTTWQAIRQRSNEIHQVSPERIRDEMIKIFTRPGAAHGFGLLSESGLMKEILPEIEAMKKVDQSPDYHPEGDVFVHTKLLLEKLKEPSLALALGALFHDVGKPPTYAIREGRITFYEHAPLGAKMTEEIMRRLRFSNQETDAVCSCVENHMKFADVQKMRSGKLKQFIARPNFSEELELHRIDCLSSHGKLDNYVFLKNKLAEYAEEDLKPKPAITGHDLMALGMKPGPKMKQVLEAIYEMQLEGAVKDREQALAAAKNKIKQLDKG
ncbi:MAG: CCA tRNA nucleotidyltransferase [Candidatus Omnitrophica bacterium]|nr:CCA tRNA nucleotidyltransferase [Candidatus Omnitrophota bacterium]